MQTKLLFPTQYTREQLAGKRTPTRSMVNRKALDQPMRKRLWEARQKAETCNAS